MKRSRWTEVLVLWGAGLVILLASDVLAGFGGWAAENAGALPAAFFLLAPVAWLRRRDQDPADAGIHGRRPLVALAWAAGVALAVFPPYVVGYEAWSRWVAGERFRVPEHPLAYYESAVRGRPATWSTVPAVHVWMDGEWLHAVNTGPVATPLTIQGCGCPAVALSLGPDGRLWSSARTGSCPAGGPITATVGRGRGVACPSSAADRLILQAEGDAPWRLGAAAGPRPAGPLILDRSPWWLVEVLLIHLVVVALPEEVFYRGFVQARLAPLFRRRIRVLGASLGPHVVVASALFALSHLVTIPHPYRLAVFFPGLLFGWLRERTGGVLAPAVLHAASNVLLEFLVRFHGAGTTSY